MNSIQTIGLIIFVIGILAASLVVRHYVVNPPEWLIKAFDLIGQFLFELLPYSLGLFMILWFLSYTLKTLILHEQYEDFWYVVILWLIIIGHQAYNGKLHEEVDINRCRNFKGWGTGWIYCKWPGFNFTTPLENFFKEVQTDKHLVYEAVKKTWQVTDDAMLGKLKIFYMVNILHNRDVNMKKYVKATEDNIKESIEFTANTNVMDKVLTLTEAQAKAQRRLIFANLRTIFATQIAEYGIRMLPEGGLEDLDNSLVVQKAKENLRAGVGIGDLYNTLRTANPNLGHLELMRLVKLQTQDGRYKQTEITRSSADDPDPQILVNNP